MNEVASEKGVITTFYSYKGGTGRSMALANTACLLGQRAVNKAESVLVVDWDLEAPGLHHYFPRSKTPAYRDRPGLIDYFWKMKEIFDAGHYERITRADGASTLNNLVPLRDYVVPEVSDGVDLMPAGRFGSDYEQRVASFDWVEFYNNYRLSFRVFAENLSLSYPWCLIDSRTGLSDISGICTMLMPEKLVPVFTPNQQSLEGVLDLVERAIEYRRSYDDLRPLSVFPLPSRIVKEEHDLLRDAKNTYSYAFQRLFQKSYALTECDLKPYFDEVLIPHDPFYAFDERVAVRDDPTDNDALSLYRAYERFTTRLSVLDSPWEIPPVLLQPPVIVQAPVVMKPPVVAEAPFIVQAKVMIQVQIAHSDKDSDFAQDLANFLERGGEIRTFVNDHDIYHGDSFVSRIESGLNTDAVLVVLSPDAVRTEWVEKEWKAAMASRIPIVPVLCRDCTPPKLLAGLHRFDVTKNRLDEFPKIKAWLLHLRPNVPPPFHAPARPPLFIGRVAELDALQARLAEEGSVVPVEGLAGLGKTTLALEFAHRHKRDFEAVYWLQCVGRDLASLASDLASQLGVALEGDLETILGHLRKECARKRCLLVLDNVEDERPAQLIPNGRASILVTTRREYLAFLGHGERVKPDLFTEEECFLLFRDVLGEKELAKNEASAKVLFERLGNLPIAISVAAGLIKHDIRYSIDNLAKKLPRLEKLSFGKDNVGALLKDAIAALGDNERKLLAAMAVCAPDGFHLPLAAEVAELPEDAALDGLQELKSRSLTEELDRESRRYRLQALVRAATEPSDALRLRHAEAVSKLFDSWESNWRERQQDLGDLREALEWTLGASTEERLWSLSSELGYKGYSLTSRIGRLPEAYELSERLARAAETRGDNRASQAWYGNQALILQAWGRLDEALVLHKKQEAICEELGNRDGLQKSYGNQALILQCWGRLDEALALHKKQEAICEELGDRDGLNRSYGNQALILKIWGRLDEALALHTREEAICQELGDMDGLQASYGNQALILKARGQLDEALALIKNKEVICEELGNRDGLQRSYGGRASILQAWGRLDEALALLKKQEEISKELGNRDSLARCYGAMAILARERGDQDVARTRAEAALAIFDELKMPRETEAMKDLLQEISGTSS